MLNTQTVPDIPCPQFVKTEAERIAPGIYFDLPAKLDQILSAEAQPSQLRGEYSGDFGLRSHRRKRRRLSFTRLPTAQR